VPFLSSFGSLAQNLSSNIMLRVLMTAFEPFDRWTENSSWLALMELTRSLPESPKIVTRRYPVDFAKAKERLSEDLTGDYDFALHLGQSSLIGRIELEAIGLNVKGDPSQSPGEFSPLVAGGPAAYRTSLPLARWAAMLREEGVPAQVSYHAGTYLCNAVYYLSQHLAAEQRLKTRSAFIHLPLAPQQILGERQDWPSLPSEVCARGIRVILGGLAREATSATA
jgi:pyroglutamyl-peptidase